jgi:hypothetical protein
LLTAMSLEGAGLGTCIIEWLVALGTAWVLQGRSVVPDGGTAGQGKVFEHARTHAREASIEFGLDLTQARFGMHKAPLAHLTGELFG